LDSICKICEKKKKKKRKKNINWASGNPSAQYGEAAAAQHTYFPNRFLLSL
jgi:hypothetical protein